MPKFRKKPVVIEAMQVPPEDDNWKEIIEWVTEKAGDRPVEVKQWGFLIHTLEGLMEAGEGDWIICGVQGELYPCKPDIFEQTYEPIDEA